jgi:hypothetical protein
MRSQFTYIEKIKRNQFGDADKYQLKKLKRRRLGYSIINSIDKFEFKNEYLIIY